VKPLPVSQDAKNSIVLIGGPMTMDDGSKLDSRQPVEGDPASQIVQRSLGTSWLWWETASSVVLPILDGGGPNVFALIFGQRSVVEVDSRGELKRTRLGSILRGGVGSVSVVRTGIGDNELPEGYEEVAALRAWNGESLGVIGVRDGEAGCRWRFVEGPAYLEHTAERIGARVVVNTDPWMPGPVDQGRYGSARFEALERDLLSLDGSVLVLPHTHATEGWLGSYVDWVESGRPVSPPTSQDLPAWDPEGPPDPIRYTHAVPARADFQVTGLIQDGQWRDSADLEAARSLLHSRYDLKIGIWDLAGNRVLRSTLLDESGTPAPPSEAAQVPHGAAERADAVVREKLDQRALIRSIVERMNPLRAAGWQAARYPYEQMHLPLTEPLALWPGREETEPLLWLTLTVSKRRTTVSVWSPMDREVDLVAHVKELQSQLSSSAGEATIDLDSGWPTIWKAHGGWGDDVDWSARARELASRTSEWFEMFRGLADECRGARRERWRTTRR
jgi:hypothetical protein